MRVASKKKQDPVPAVRADCSDPAERIGMLLGGVPGFEKLANPGKSVESAEKRAEREETELVDEVEEVESRLLAKSSEILEGALRFYEIEDDDEIEDPLLKKKGPPKEWVDLYGEQEANRRHRLARYAQRSTRDSPVGTFLARDLYLGILAVRVKRGEAVQPASLNVSFTQINVAPPPRYPELEVVDDGKRTRL